MVKTHVRFSIAIDGTAASGKSTVARLLAEKLGCSYLDTGKLYRALALKFLTELGDDPEAWAEQTDRLQAALKGISFELLTPPSGECRILLDGQDVNDELSALVVEQATPFAARLGTVRDFLLDVQRDLAQKSSVVMAGRDIGSVVLPDATLKIFIDAELAERARRRLAQHSSEFTELELAEAAKALQSRDQKDANRALAPMVRAEDSLELDSTHLTPDELVAQINAALEARLVRNS